MVKIRYSYDHQVEFFDLLMITYCITGWRNEHNRAKYWLCFSFVCFCRIMTKFFGKWSTNIWFQGSEIFQKIFQPESSQKDLLKFCLKYSGVQVNDGQTPQCGVWHTPHSGVWCCIYTPWKPAFLFFTFTIPLIFTFTSHNGVSHTPFYSTLVPNPSFFTQIETFVDFRY